MLQYLRSVLQLSMFHATRHELLMCVVGQRIEEAVKIAIDCTGHKGL